MTAAQLEQFKRTAFERMLPQKQTSGFSLRLVALLGVGARDGDGGDRQDAVGTADG